MLLINIVSKHSVQFIGDKIYAPDKNNQQGFCSSSAKFMAGGKNFTKIDQHSSSQMSASSELLNIYNFVLQTVFSVAMMIVQHFENTTLKSGYLCLSRRCHQQARQSRRSGWGRLCGEHCPSQG